jgi:acetamidase/formamidase
MIEMGPKTLLDIEACMGQINADGPVYVNGAEPGDTLNVEILQLQTGGWGWLFAVGDPHFSQGDGEITGTALETTMRSRIRLSVIKGKKPLKSPYYVTNPELVKQMHSVGGEGEYGVLATAVRRDNAIKEAVRGLFGLAGCREKAHAR